MALFEINPAETEPILTELFFYIKGSKDYPSNQVLTKPFGYDPNDATQENPIFRTSIADLYKKLHRPRVVDNLYSLESDVPNGIPSLTGLSRNRHIRYDRSKEFVSTFVINNGDPTDPDSTNKYSDHIDPNYDIDTTKNIGSFDTLTAVNNVTNYEHVFWQKMFTLTEFIKKNEQKIIFDDMTPGSLPEWVREDNAGDAGYWTESKYEALTKELAKETTIGRYIALFIGNSDVYSTLQEAKGSQESFDLDPSGKPTHYYWNPIRTEALYGTTGNLQTNDEKYEEYLWMQNCLDITYIPYSANFVISEAHNSGESRIASFEFQVRYRYNANSYQNILLRIFFDPDEMIATSIGSNLKVYTYNDTDLDGQYSVGFNRYDNDYSNLLSEDERLKNKFLVSNREVEENIINEIHKIFQTGEYTGWVKFSTKRVTPVLSADKTDIAWKDENSTNQNFYIFYNGTEPTLNEQIAAVQDYLKTLHTGCLPTCYDEEDGTIKHIGHTEDTKLDFLAKMYPDLFVAINIHVFPIGVNMYNNNGNPYPLGGSFDPMKYFHTITPNRIYETIRSYSGFKNFKLDEKGNVIITQASAADAQVYLPAEVLYTGGINSIPSQDTGDVLAYDFPWITTCRGEQTTLPLTSRVGFGDYRQRWFQGTVNFSNMTSADIFQFILIQLAIDMFTEDKSNFKRHKTIAGVPIEYSCNDFDTKGESNVCNEVTFRIRGVRFTVHSQIGKNFGLMANKKED